MGRATLRQRLVAGLVAGLAALALRLPDPFLHRLADLLGALWYVISPGRRALARANLARVCAALAARGEATSRVAAAAGGGRALERLVLAAFRHNARYYLEMMLAPRYTAAYLLAHLRVETPDAVTALFPGGRLTHPAIIVGMHFGALELPSLLITRVHGQSVTAPMERLPNPALQAYLERTRGATGVRIVGIRGSASVLRAELARGALVGLIADRDIGGNGVPVDLFGVPARLPAGPALLALETGADVYVGAVRRTGWGRYAGGAIRLERPEAGTRRQRVEAYLREEARAFERFVAQAPEQWWSVFFPIWMDLAPTTSGAAPGPAGDARAVVSRRPAPAHPAGAPASAGDPVAGVDREGTP